jgi:hypothetical protein
MSGREERRLGRAAGRDGARGTSCSAARPPRCLLDSNADLINRFDVALQGTKATVVSFGARDGIAGLRRRRPIADSRRILARDDRAAHLAAAAEPPK